MDKSNSKEVQKYIKSILETHKNNHYNHDLHTVITDIVTIVENSEHNVDNHDTKLFISNYMHYSATKKGYYFNTKKKQTGDKQKYYHDLINNKNKQCIQDQQHNQKSVTRKKTEFIFIEDNEKTFIATRDNNLQINASTDWGFNDDNDDNDDIDNTGFMEIESENETNKSEHILTQVELDDLEKEFANDTTFVEEAMSKYAFPIENKYEITKRNDIINGPYGTQWIHDVQCHDELDGILELHAIKYDDLRAIKLPEQRSVEWFNMREGKITASDGGTVIGQNKHEPQFEFILKKVVGREFTSNKFCYHGKKLEEIATMIYRYRMNTQVDDFGLMGHPKYSFLGASPDGICTRYKLDGIHRSKFVGRMLEIKCPFVRKIQTSGEIKDHICPIYYWVQVQLQLECCELEECDFWQCKLDEYTSREEFINDTDEKEPFRSLTFGREKGVLLQLLPHGSIEKIKEKGYLQTIYEDATFIYPPKIEMSPYDVDIWVSETISKLKQTNSNEYLDKVIYWRLEQSHNVTIQRDKKWFQENLPTYEKMWNYVLFLRKNKERTTLLVNYINSRTKKMNADIMSVVDKMCTLSDNEYKEYRLYLENSIKIGEKQKLQKLKDKDDKLSTHFDINSCMFDD